MRIATAIIAFFGIAGALRWASPTLGQDLQQPAKYEQIEQRIEQPIEYGATETLPKQPATVEQPRFWQEWPILSRYVSVPPVIIDSRFAYPVGGTGLRKLGPCQGACEVGWYAGRLWFRPEILAWDTKGVHIPALATTDQPDSFLFAGGLLHEEIRLGGRLTAGFWCSPAQREGVEVVYFGLGARDISYFADSADFPVITRPYRNATNSNAMELHPVADDGALSGTGILSGQSLGRVDSEMAGAEVLLRQAITWTPQLRVDFLAGYRHAHLFDRVLILDQSISLDALSGYPVDTLIEREDLFRTDNDFHGGEVGISARWWRGCWSWQVQSKLACGGAFRRRTIAGRTTDIDFGSADPVETTVDGGVLALPSNIGFRKESDTSVLAELGLTLEYQIRHNMRVAVGYTALYWDSVTRVDSLINTSINPTQIPPGTLMGAASPTFPSEHISSFWAQGFNASLECQY